MPEDDFDIYGEDDGYNDEPSAEVRRQAILLSNMLM